MVKRTDYSGTKPHIDGIDFKIYKDDATAFLDYKAGNLDKCNIPSGQYKDTSAQYGIADDAGLTANPGKQTWNGPELGIYEIVINNQNDLFKNNQKLREAISLAINRQAISDAVFEGLRVPATSIIPEGTVGYEAERLPVLQVRSGSRQAGSRRCRLPGWQRSEDLHPVVQQQRVARSHHAARAGRPESHRHQHHARRL